MLRSILKSTLKRTPYRVIRARDGNRFQAIEECLASLARRGYAPARIVDGGANVGDFARSAARIFRPSVVHLVEPQPACAKYLERLEAEVPYRFHGVALGSEDSFLDLAIDPNAVTTGAHILPTAQSPEGSTSVRVPVMRLDTMLGPDISAEDRTLLKLDLQGWELEALRGAEGILDRIEVALIEVSFFVQAYEPSVETLVRFLDDRGFALHDIAALAARGRDNRAHQGDFLFVRRDSALASDTAWG